MSSVALKSQEHHDLMLQFERDCRPGRIDREAKDLWPRGIVYQDGHVNDLFKVYRMGFVYGKVIERSATRAVLDEALNTGNGSYKP